MLFPYLETPEGYPRLLEENGWEVTVADDLSRDFAEQFTMYQTMIQGELRRKLSGNSATVFFQRLKMG